MSFPLDRQTRREIINVVSDPLGTARVAKRMSTFATLTALHLRRVPDDLEQRGMNLLANAWAGELLKHMGFALQVHGTPGGRGALLVANHRSYTDITVLLASTPCCFLAKGGVADWPVLGTAAVRAGTVFVDRSAKDSRAEAKATMRRLLEAGHTVVVFPEGTTMPPPGCGSFRRGAFVAAHEAGVPVLPVAIEYPNPLDNWGDEGFLQHFNRTFRQPRVNVHLHFGPTIEGLPPQQLMDETHAWIDGRLRQLWAHFEQAR